jgi:hypothetical protein
MIYGETVETGLAHPGTLLMVLQSGAGFYLGYVDKDGHPYSRETEYFSSYGGATRALHYWRQGNKIGKRQPGYSGGTINVINLTTDDGGTL